MFVAELIVKICVPPDIPDVKLPDNIVNTADEGETMEWPEIWPDNCDIHIGPINAQEMCVCMLRWSLDGQTINKHEHKRVMKKIKKIFKNSREAFKVIMETIKAEIRAFRQKLERGNK